jgi:hypothetical protein
LLLCTAASILAVSAQRSCNHRVLSASKHEVMWCKSSCSCTCSCACSSHFFAHQMCTADVSIHRCCFTEATAAAVLTAASCLFQIFQTSVGVYVLPCGYLCCLLHMQPLDYQQTLLKSFTLGGIGLHSAEYGKGAAPARYKVSCQTKPCHIYRLALCILEAVCTRSYLAQRSVW